MKKPYERPTLTKAGHLPGVTATVTKGIISP
jgi:hypothetical protein